MPLPIITSFILRMFATAFRGSLGDPIASAMPEAGFARQAPESAWLCRNFPAYPPAHPALLQCTKTGSEAVWRTKGGLAANQGMAQPMSAVI
jgi:hypothetical protein